jgi:hypothetical protein
MRPALCLALLALAAAPCRAEYAVMTIEGTASGTLGGAAFSNAHVAFTAAYDTAAVAEESLSVGRHWFAPAAGVVTVEGLGTAEALVPATVDSYSSDAPGHFPPSTIAIFFPDFDVQGGLGPFNLDYGLSTDFGPAGLGFGPPPFVGFPDNALPTTAGVLTLTSQSGTGWTATVQVAPVPAPPALVLLEAGAALLLARAWRRRG